VALWLAKISSVSKIVCVRYFPREHVDADRTGNPPQGAVSLCWHWPIYKVRME